MSFVRVMFVTIIGSMDEIALIPPIIQSGVINSTQLVIGFFIASVIVAIISLFLAQLRCVANCVKHIPVYLIVTLR